MRPDFIPAEAFRIYAKSTYLNKYLSVDGILCSSFLSRCERNGNPVRSLTNAHGKHYRLLDVVARARAECLEITPPQTELLAATISDLRAMVQTLTLEKQQIESAMEATKHRLMVDELSRSLTRASILSEEEIVAQANELPMVCGVYFLIREGEIIYVGQSVNMASRVSTHYQTRVFDKVAYLPCGKHQLDIVESLYIHILQPPENGRYYGGENHGRAQAPLSFERLLELATFGPPTPVKVSP